MKRQPKRNPKLLVHRINKLRMRHLGKPWDEKRLKPMQERIDAQRHFIAKENALNHRVYLDKMKSIGSGAENLYAK